jgi:hypothetical protein
VIITFFSVLVFFFFNWYYGRNTGRRFCSVVIITFFSVLVLFFFNWYYGRNARRRFYNIYNFLPLSHSRCLPAGCKELLQGGADG